MAGFTHRNIHIVGAMGLKELYEMKIQILPNTHGTAVLEGLIDENSNQWEKNLTEHKIEIYLLQQGKTDIPLFAGYVKCVEKIYKRAEQRVKIILDSATILLDRKKEYHSFQDVSCSYEEIIDKAVEKTSGAVSIFTKKIKRYPVKPLIQYGESGWEFVLRLASHLGTVVYPDCKQKNPVFYVGFPVSSRKVHFEDTEYVVGISSRYYELGGRRSGYEKRDFQYYQVESYQNYDIGMQAEIQGNVFYICEKRGILEGSQMKFTYMLGREPLVSLKPRKNQLLSGMSIFGKVLAVEAETVKIHLDIDKEQSVETAYPYEWVPDTGSVMYCMPQIGTRVSLYFSSEEEDSAMAVNCIRTNGASCPKTGRTQDRYLATEYDKELYLKPDTMGVASEKQGHFINLLDKDGVRMDSANNVVIAAGSKIVLKGKKVCLETPLDIKMEKY